jgi:hypothetical protein
LAEVLGRRNDNNSFLPRPKIRYVDLGFSRGNLTDESVYLINVIVRGNPVKTQPIYQLLASHILSD